MTESNNSGGFVSCEELHDLANVPEGASVTHYEWVEGGLNVEYEQPE